MSDRAAEEQIAPEAWRALAIGAAGFVLIGFNSTATNIAFGDIADSFPSVPETTVSWVASGYFIGTAALLPLGGRIADRHGRRTVFLAGVAGFAVTAVLSALATTIWLLIGARVLQAIAGALVIPASLSMVLPMFPPSRRSTAVASWAAAGPLSAAIAPSVAAAVLEISNWRVLYFLSAPVAAAILVIGLRQLRDVRPDESTGRLDVLGTVLGTLAIALVVVATGKGNDWGWTSLATVGCYAGSVVALAAFIVRSNRHPEPLLDLSLFRLRTVWMTNLANTLISVTSLSIWLVWPLYLRRVWDYSAFDVGVALTAGPICAGTMSLVGGRLADRFGHRWPITVGSAVMVGAVAWSWLLLDPDGTYWTSFLPSIAAFGFGWGLSSPAMNSLVLLQVPESRWSEGNAAFNMLRNVGAAIGTAGAIAILGDSDRSDLIAAFDRTYRFFFAWTLAALLVIVVAYPRSGPASTDIPD